MNVSMEHETVIRVSTVDYVTFVKLSYIGWSKLLERFKAQWEMYNFPSSFIDDIQNKYFLTWVESSSILLMAVFWTWLRIYLTNNLFEVRSIFI